MRIERVGQGEDAQAALRRLEQTGGVMELHGLVRAPSRLRYESTHPLSIIGYGAGLSGFIFTGQSGGLDVAVEDEFEAGAMRFEGFGCYATGFYDDAGFRLASNNNRGGPRPASSIRDVVCSTAPGRWRRGGSFRHGIHLHDMPHVRIDHPFLYGPGDRGSALYLSGDCTPGPVVTDLAAYYWQHGVANSGDGITEGTRLFNPQMVNNQYGVRWDNRNTGGEPGVQVVGGHIASSIANVRGWRAHQINVRGVLFYARGDAAEDFADVDLSGCISASVTGNISSGPGRSNGETAVLRTNRCRAVKYASNLVQGNARKHGWLRG